MGNIAMTGHQGVLTRLTEGAELFLTNLIVQKRNFIEFMKVASRYYTKGQFLLVDQALLRQYFFKNPFRISRDYLKNIGESNIYAYGETPLTTLDRIAKQCGITNRDTVYELGCGRARTCFWLNTMMGCKVVGVDFVPAFIAKAEKVRAKFNLTDITFRSEDILETDLTGATFVYLYGTCYDTPMIRKLVERFSTLPSGTKILTVSYPLKDYSDEPIFELMNCFEAEFTWGKAEVFLQIRK